VDTLHELFQEMGTVDDLELFAESGNYRVTFTRNQTNYQIDASTMDGLIARLEVYLKPEIGIENILLSDIQADVQATKCSFFVKVDVNTNNITCTRTKKVI